MQFLIIARAAAGTPIEQVLPFVKSEAEKVWEYYAADMLRTIHYIADMSGAVLMFEAMSLEAVQEAVAQFPMAQANVLQFEILPLKPYTGLDALFGK